ncbi:BRO-N domain-containing protein [Devosia aquimaris]|uniref:BRO-N domain-containing protein n=1 Tax=Devosia aquimaris TaxID=2866214 RepID=UPI001CD08DA8|nr:Bro-N domain-containing protein [Devosia sp. CJK-A8-3]
MAQYVLQLFEDNDHDQFRVIDKDGDPWFVLNEVCKKLGLANPGDVASRLDDDEKDAIGVSDAIGRTQKMTIINESGLYNAILRSNKPEAKTFRKWVTSEVLPAIRKTGGYRGGVPAFIKRANENWSRVDQGYFSVINELAVIVWGRMEREGHIMADKAPDGRQNRPDVSVGIRFAKWLDAYHPKLCGNYKMYQHKTDEWEGEARQYPNSMLGLFREYVETVWWPECFEDYIKTRDPKALTYLQKLLPPKKKAS